MELKTNNLKDNQFLFLPGFMTVVTSAGTPTTGSLAAAAGLPEVLCKIAMQALDSVTDAVPIEQQRL